MKGMTTTWLSDLLDYANDLYFARVTSDQEEIEINEALIDRHITELLKATSAEVLQWESWDSGRRPDAYETVLIQDAYDLLPWVGYFDGTSWLKDNDTPVPCTTGLCWAHWPAGTRGAA